VAEHRNLGRPATVTAVRPTGRFGALELDADAGRVEEFREKNEGQDSWVNGGFFVLEPAVLPLIQGDDCSWENDVLPELIRRGQLSAYRHGGFWQPMDTLREKLKLQQLWESGEAPWKIW
jgi:glucose-1-phosphate cytidylyltransferase